MKKIVAAVGEVVDVDDDVEELRKMDRARVLLKTPWTPAIHHTVSVHIQGETFPIHIIEETGSSSNTCRCRCSENYSSSEDIYSEDSETVSAWELMMSKAQGGAQKEVVSEESRALTKETTPAEKTTLEDIYSEDIASSAGVASSADEGGDVGS